MFRQVVSRRGPRLVCLAAIASAGLVGLAFIPSVGASTKPNQISFSLYPNPTTVACASNGADTPTVNVTVKRGKLNDQLDLTLDGFKPGLLFDLFTVQRSNQLANGSPDPNFHNFGLAWYQSDVQVKSSGDGAHVSINTILLDQIFGFDPDVALSPTNTFHVGFWFNNPADAASCGFTGVTPFNGSHNAGPLAFISRPDAVTGLGPLCSDPNSLQPSGCNP